MAIRTIVVAGLVAALYVVLTIGLAPLSYNVVQFRVSEALKPLALYSPVFALAFAAGTFLSNLYSPFGVWDWGIMPLVDCIAALVCWQLRRWPVVGLFVQAVIIAAGVAIFPLGIAARLPWMLSFVYVVAPQLVLLFGGYFLIWRWYGPRLLRGPDQTV